MDRTVISTEKLVRLQNIANLSAVVLVETDTYVELAIAIEHYVKDINPENFIRVIKTLEACAKRVSTFHNSREQLMALLMSHGTITRITEHPSEPPIDKEEPSTPDPKPPTTNNVVNLSDFRKKKVDNPK